MKRQWKYMLAALGLSWSLACLPMGAEAARYELPQVGSVEIGSGMELADLAVPQWGQQAYSKLENAWPGINEQVQKQLGLETSSEVMSVPRIYQLKGSDEAGRHIAWLFVCTITKEAAQAEAGEDGFFTDDMFQNALSPDTVTKFRKLPKTIEEAQEKADKAAGKNAVQAKDGAASRGDMSVRILGYEPMERFYTGQEFIWRESTRTAVGEGAWVMPIGITSYLLDRGDVYAVVLAAVPDSSYQFFHDKLDGMMSSLTR